MATPEHILRAGRLPVWLDLDLDAPPDRVAGAVRAQLARQREEYEQYHRRHAPPGERPLDDWAKVVLVRGLGMITALADKRSAVTANLCYRAVLETIANAEAVDAFRFLPEADVFEFEHWPLERRKLDAQNAREIATAAPGRAIGVATDVRDDRSLARLFERTVLEFGGLDCLFYTAGLTPRFAGVADIRREDLQRQLDVHYLGAVLAMGAAAAVMRRQGLGGSIVASVSKAALAPGREAAAYGGSKAALLQAMRVAAVELGGDRIRVNAINADQIDTPLFLRFVQERAAARGGSVEQQLEAYRRRNAMGVSLIPPEVVADLAALLASDRFRFTTGDILTVDGGLPEAFPRCTGRRDGLGASSGN